jgi:hypothetical protein
VHAMHGSCITCEVAMYDKTFVVCEDNTIVENLEGEYRDYKIPELTIRVDLEDGDGEFVDVKTLADLYRRHVLKVPVRSDTRVWMEVILQKYGIKWYHGLWKDLDSHVGKIWISDMSAAWNGRMKFGRRRRDIFENGVKEFAKTK